MDCLWCHAAFCECACSRMSRATEAVIGMMFSVLAAVEFCMNDVILALCSAWHSRKKKGSTFKTIETPRHERIAISHRRTAPISRLASSIELQQAARTLFSCSSHSTHYVTHGVTAILHGHLERKSQNYPRQQDQGHQAIQLRGLLGNGNEKSTPES